MCCDVVTVMWLLLRQIKELKGKLQAYQDGEIVSARAPVTLDMAGFSRYAELISSFYGLEFVGLI